MFANALAAFTIERPIDENGKTVEPTGGYTPEMFGFPGGNTPQAEKVANPISAVSESYLPSGYINLTYGSSFQAILAQGVGHTVPLFEQQYL
ncbi:carbohydrate esterase family 1 protein [Phlebiopsis gigantea 11061_1 CR5-6]|uniref:Carbohydrate esterase family 1 protein n=1 Tax=Phlebiopsis gigantea (strain 11061_1 CR5-6) TaxID=745531 RepID=A0A0C3RSY6_PHLG1|nr:carbohydrate esterase family 1 protein [Phlebiopsis gigantea 11061_1 CR5-6]